jgi:hypothetical protein
MGVTAGGGLIGPTSWWFRFRAWLAWHIAPCDHKGNKYISKSMSALSVAKGCYK